MKEGGDTSELSKRINRFFFNPLTPKREKENVADKLNDKDKYDISDNQAKIFRMRYIEDKNIGYISDEMGYSPSLVKQELAMIRTMLDKLDIL